MHLMRMKHHGINVVPSILSETGVQEKENVDIVLLHTRRAREGWRREKERTSERFGEVEKGEGGRRVRGEHERGEKG